MTAQPVTLATIELALGGLSKENACQIIYLSDDMDWSFREIADWIERLF
jgi:hypothetical protein